MEEVNTILRRFFANTDVSRKETLTLVDAYLQEVGGCISICCKAVL
jgi:hypothetical protein